MKHSQSTIEIKLATIDDLEQLTDHDLRHMRETGFQNLPAHPFLSTHNFIREDFLIRKIKLQNTPIGETGWGRSFIALHENRIVGHLNLRNDLETALHRVSLGMGIEANYRNQKIGKLLMNEAISFCKKNHIEYIDLSVFDHNLPAKKLYQSFGFQEIGTVKDLFRMNNTNIDDVKMVLKL